MFTNNTYIITLAKAHTRGLPDDVHGPVRVVEIGDVDGENLDSNMCCGTHVSNLAQLQALKIVKAEKGKKVRSIDRQSKRS